MFYDNFACSGDENTKCLILHGDADDINPLSDTEKFLTQLGEQGEMEILLYNNHFWTETDEQKNFLEENITDFLIQNLFTIYSSEESEEETESKELIENGDFSNGTENWDIYVAGGADANMSVENEQLIVSISDVGTLSYGVQPYYSCIPLYKNGVYRLQFDISSSLSRIIDYRIQQDGGNYTSYVGGNLPVTSETQHIDETFAKKCLDASEKAWTYLESGEGSLITENPSGISTGAYEDTSFADERYWAAAQLYKATGKLEYKEAFEKSASTEVYTGFGWQSMGHFGNIAYLNIDETKTDSAIVEKISNTILEEANAITDLSKLDGYSVAMENYYWGSNMTIMNQGLTLLLADNITPSTRYRNIASEHLNYVLGKNPMAMSYVTGYGTISPMYPHHRPSMVTKTVISGMVVGGANQKLEDSVVKSKCKNSPSALCYVDDYESYSTNEVDTYRNSPLIYMLSQLNIEKDK